MKLYHLKEKSTTVQDVDNQQELDYLQNVTDLLKQTLGISGRQIIVSFKPPYDLDPSQLGVTIGVGHDPNKIFVLIDGGLSTGEKVMALSHEFVHVKQIDSGRLVIAELKKGKISGEWEGEPYDFTNYSKSNPWEVEAYTQEKELRRLVVQKLGNFSQ